MELVGLTNKDLCKELCKGLLRAILAANYKATRRYVTYILHQKMNIKSNGTDVMIVRMIPEYFAARKFFLHLASVWLETGVSREQGKEDARWVRRNSVKPLEYYISTQAVAEIIRLLASKENQSCRSFAEEFLMSFLRFFSADGDISVALKEILDGEDAEAQKIAEKLAVKIHKSYK